MIANSGLRAAIFLKHRSQPWGASSSGSMCVSVKNTKSKEPGALVSAARSKASDPPNAAAAPVAAAVFRNFLRSRIMRAPQGKMFQRRESYHYVVLPCGFGRVMLARSEEVSCFAQLVFCLHR